MDELSDRDEGEAGEWFHFGHRTFNITDAKALIAAEDPGETRRVETALLVPFLVMVDVDPVRAAALPDVALNEPLIAVNDNGAVLVVDGHHRVQAAVDRGHDTLPVHVLTEAQSRVVERTPGSSAERSVMAARIWERWRNASTDEATWAAQCCAESWVRSAHPDGLRANWVALNVMIDGRQGISAVFPEPDPTGRSIPELDGHRQMLWTAPTTCGLPERTR